MFSNSNKQTNAIRNTEDKIVAVKLSLISNEADIVWGRVTCLCIKYYECLKSHKNKKTERKRNRQMKSGNYRYELEELNEEKFFLLHARVAKKTTKHVDSMFGGYKLRTYCLDKVQCGVYRNGKIVKKITTDHLWVCEDTCTVAKDKNIEVGDIVIFKAYTKEYRYSHGARQIGIDQYDPSHRNISQDYVIDYRKRKQK